MHFFAFLCIKKHFFSLEWENVGKDEKKYEDIEYIRNNTNNLQQNRAPEMFSFCNGLALPGWWHILADHERRRKMKVKKFLKSERTKQQMLRDAVNQNELPAPNASSSAEPMQMMQMVETGPEEVEDSFGYRLRLNLDRNAKIELKWKQTSSQVTLATLWTVEAFPTDRRGSLKWPGSAAAAASMRHRIHNFLETDAKCNQGRASRVWPCMLAAAFPWMATWTLSDQLFAIVARILHHRMEGRAWCDYVEFFCGHGNLSRAAIAAGLEGLSFDITLSMSHDALSGDGFALMLTALAATKARALVWHGTPCSSFTVMSRGTSLRAAENDFLGDLTKDFVCEGNGLCDATSCTMLISHLADCTETLEQSGSSCMPLTPPMVGVLAFIEASRVLTYHSCFGAETLKPFQLWSGKCFLLPMARSKPPCCGQENLAVKGSEGQFTGVKSKLVQSQVYTIEFGRAVISALLAYWQSP